MWLDRTWSFNILVPLIAIGIFILLVVAYPFIEAWVKGDKREHHIADRPRNAPTRTAIGAAGVTFYAGLWAAASSDILATHFSLTMEGVIHALQAMVIIGPFVAYFIAKRVCIALQKKDREIVLHGYESGRIVKLPGGEFIEVHQPLDEYDRWRLVSYETYEPLMIRPNSRGKITVGQRLRAGMSRWFFEDRIAPVTKGELEASHSDAPLSRPHSDSGTGPMSIDTTWLRCPNCFSDLSAIDERVFGCAAGHRFDRARQGYLTLLPPRAPRTVGDDREMLAARAALLDGGAYSPIAAAIADAVAAVPPDGHPGASLRIADLGCGTGYYSASIARAVPDAAFLLADRSPDAVRISLRALPAATGVVLDLWRPLPIRDGVVDVALNVFAPAQRRRVRARARTERTARRRRPSRRAPAGAPRAGAVLDVPAGKADRVAEQLAASGFDAERRRRRSSTRSRRMPRPAGSSPAWARRRTTSTACRRQASPAMRRSTSRSPSIVIVFARSSASSA